MNTIHRKIIHIDMDCFFIAVEMRDQPELYHIPAAVGGLPEKRGVIATCNYPARQFGIHSAMSSAQAKARCPELVILPSDITKYRQVSSDIHSILKQFTNMIEPLSLDEAYLDVTHCDHHSGSATLIAQNIRQQIEAKLGLTASAGVAPNKLIAKIASDMNKPNGLCVVTPAQTPIFVSQLPVAKLFGVGKATCRKLDKLGVVYCSDLQKLPLSELHHNFGKFGGILHQYCRGIDNRPVNCSRIRKSLSIEHTFSKDISHFDQLIPHAKHLITQLKQQHQKKAKHRIIKRVGVKLKFADFKQTTAEITAYQITLDIILPLIRRARSRSLKPIRLLGLSITFDTDNIVDQQQQIDLLWAG